MFYFVNLCRHIVYIIGKVDLDDSETQQGLHATITN